MSKLGCSLKEAFGESWNAGPKYYQTSPERFRVMDPYSTNAKPQISNFVNSDECGKENFDLFQMKLNDFLSRENITKLWKEKEEKEDKETFKNISTNNILDSLLNLFNDALASERIDCLVRFALVSILIINLLDFISE